MEHPPQNPYVSPQEFRHGKAKLGRWKLGRQFAGWGLMALGIAGLILPVMPGWIFIAWGCVTLAPDVPFFARLLDRVAQRVPPLRAAIERVRSMSED